LHRENLRTRTFCPKPRWTNKTRVAVVWGSTCGG